MIDIFYSEFNEPLSNEYWSVYLNMLTDDLRKKALSYNRWQDRHAYVFGKLLLLQGLSMHGFDKDVFSQIKYTKYGKPFLEGNINFNISHSAKRVVCAVGENVQLGIDVEAIENVNFNDFENVMTDSQWQFIHNSYNPLKSFFSLWTMKESVIKADGRGLSIPLLEIHIDNNIVRYERKTWHLKELYFDNNTCSCLATNLPNSPVRFTKVNFAFGIEKIQTSLGYKSSKMNIR
ncbi:4'-phosphopantetheinyl transferase superfamily protein [Aquimarina sp. AU474]|uniref:4'-phosphopantetheinyl transferase family protein n=1 Tax=Aquimarina sp. AU474 TaxID=2108529 RepID=UPI000D69BAC5|nr:4'-phosphopantetheinyl transferase superfamily protein [Aquimarina sp. AU474]